MMKKSLLIILMVFVTACSANSSPLGSTPIMPSETPLLELNPSTQPPTNTTPSHSPTPSLSDPNQLLILDNPQPDLVATALNYQIDEYQITLTAAADQISTLDAQKKTLAANSGTGSQNNPSPNSGYDIPSDVLVATVVDYAVLEISKRNNDKGKPIMEQYKPQIKLNPGFQTWVYEDFIVADGGGRYFKVYDPDGESIADFYLRERDIQIKLKNGTPPPNNYPGDVAKARAINNVRAFYIFGYDGAGKPIMETFEPRLTFESGDSVLVHAAQVIATGNTVFYALYDPDGKPSLYLVGHKLEFLRVWD